LHKPKQVSYCFTMQTKIPTEILHCDCFIQGEWTRGEAGTISVVSPYNGKKIGECSVPSVAQVDRAIVAAAKAQKTWAQMPVKERSKILFEFRNILLREQDAISHLKSSESGKTFAEAKAGLLKG